MGRHQGDGTWILTSVARSREDTRNESSDFGINPSSLCRNLTLEM